MRVPFYNIKAQYDELHAELDAAVHAVLSSGTYTISGGTVCRELEKDLAILLDVRHAISVNSGADALRIMLDAAEIGRGDEVMVIESMKVEIPIKSPAAGRVKEFKFKIGDQIQRHSVLAVIES